jgi:hypothetical protein
MEVKSINKQKTVIQTGVANKKKTNSTTDAKETPTSQVTDTFEQTPDLTELKPVMDKLHSGYFDKPEVLKKLASILDEKFPPEMLNKVE